jgi:CRISPR system Cascade subunit CasA
MNLLTDPWLTVRWRDGSQHNLQATEITDPGALSLLSPRPDFRGGLYQFVIGLLQTAYAPEDEEEWLERWHMPPTADELANAFSPWAPYFELGGEGCSFLQDVNPLLTEPDQGISKPISSLLIDAPGGKTVRDNLDFFNKRGVVEKICPACAAAGVFALQTNAPKGGVGHRVSLRGGGPLTSLLMPREEDSQPATLWRQLWLNVLPADVMVQPGGRFDGHAPKDILPWLAPTRTSEKKDGQTTPDLAHPLQAYWGMPRRIRFDWENTQSGACDLCGEEGETLLTQFRTKNYGVNYLGWQHPLTPYYHDPKKKAPPLSGKGQKGGIGYKHWLGLALGSNDRQPEAAQVVRHYLRERWGRLGETFDTQLWVFGYDIDSMKARCWYDATLPTYPMDPEKQARFSLAVGELLAVAQEAARQLGRQVKAAWADRPADLKEEPAIAQSFWVISEPLFYRSLAAMAAPNGLEPRALALVQRDWLKGVLGIGLNLFDDWVTGEYEKGWDIERTVKAKNDLQHWLNSAKPMSALWKSVNRQLKEAS